MIPLPPHVLAALRWIVAILREENIPFQITGGLAARFHGASRPIADIDIQLPASALPRLAERTRGFIVSGPARHRDETWDLDLLTLRWNGQEIDLCGDDCRIFDVAAKSWSPLPVDVTDSDIFEVESLSLPVEKKASLIAYKTKTARECDLADLRELRGGSDLALTPVSR